jgi:DNA (cytosine-5)-methyltransferase 1
MKCSSFKSVELFTGAGGLALGLETAGCQHVLLVERDRHACSTINLNKSNKTIHNAEWNLCENTVESIDFRKLDNDIDMVAGGPPCQPFSLGGKHNGHNDSRDLFPEAIRAVRELSPKVFVFENVKGLLRQSFSKYFEYVLLQLTYPYMARKPEDTWADHLSKLEKHHTGSKSSKIFYKIVFRLLNAADYGVPQNRHRVFIVGFRSDVGREWSFPRETHNLDKLLWSQWIRGEYWDFHHISKKKRPDMPDKYKRRLEFIRHHYTLSEPSGERYQTVRDAFTGLPDPANNKDTHTFTNHKFRSGAKPYTGHTGSALDEPAKTLKAGDHGVPGGENMLSLTDGRLRYFTVRESARLQTFPDNYEFSGSWTECMRQIGNAVPVRLAEVVGRSIIEQLNQGLP